MVRRLVDLVHQDIISLSKGTDCSWVQVKVFVVKAAAVYLLYILYHIIYDPEGMEKN